MKSDKREKVLKYVSGRQCTVQALARIFKMSAPGMTSIVKGLLNDGCIEIVAVVRNRKRGRPAHVYEAC